MEKTIRFTTSSWQLWREEEHKLGGSTAIYCSIPNMLWQLLMSIVNLFVRMKYLDEL